MAADVRPARPDEGAAIARAHVLSWQSCYRGQMPDEILDSLSVDDRTQQWDARIASDEGRAGVFVADADGEIVGFASCGPTHEDHGMPGAGELQAIYLLPGWWGQGVGRTLLAKAVARLRDDGHRRAMLWVLTANDRARRFYESAGWSCDGTEQMYQRQGYDIPEVRYVRDLS